MHLPKSPWAQQRLFAGEQRHSYLLQGPKGVYHGLDLLLVVEPNEFVHHSSNEARTALFEEQVQKGKPRDDFVLFVELDGVHLLDLPPLEGEKVPVTGSQRQPRSLYCQVENRAAAGQGPGDPVGWGLRGVLVGVFFPNSHAARQRWECRVRLLRRA